MNNEKKKKELKKIASALAWDIKNDPDEFFHYRNFVLSCICRQIGWDFNNWKYPIKPATGISPELYLLFSHDFNNLDALGVEP